MEGEEEKSLRALENQVGQEEESLRALENQVGQEEEEEEEAGE